VKEREESQSPVLGGGSHEKKRELNLGLRFGPWKFAATHFSVWGREDINGTGGERVWARKGIILKRSAEVANAVKNGFRSAPPKRTF